MWKGLLGLGSHPAERDVGPVCPPGTLGRRMGHHRDRLGSRSGLDESLCSRFARDGMKAETGRTWPILVAEKLCRFECQWHSPAHADTTARIDVSARLPGTMRFSWADCNFRSLCHGVRKTF